MSVGEREQGGVSRRGFLQVGCGCALAMTAFGEAFANTDPVRVAQAGGAAAGGRVRITFLGHSVFRIDTPGARPSTSIRGSATRRRPPMPSRWTRPT
jgi:hypothetical protein